MTIAIMGLVLAAGALGGDQEAREWIQKLRSESVEERETAERTLKGLGLSAVPELERATKISDPEVVARARRVLRVVSVMQSISPNLMKVLPGIEDRLANREGYSPLDAFVEAQEAYGKAHRSGLTREDLEGVASLALQRGVGPDLQIICVLMANWKFRRLIPGLVGVVQGRDGDTAEKAAAAIAQMADPGALGAVYPLLRAEHRETRVWGLQILGAWGLPGAIPEVAARLEDASELVRGAAVESLIRLDAVERIPEILHALEDRSPTVRGLAAVALGSLQARSSVPALLKLAGDPDPWPRPFAVQALVSLRAPEVVPLLLDRLKTGEFAQRGDIQGGLVALRAKASIPGLLELLAGQDSDLRRIAIECLDRTEVRAALADISKHLDDPDPTVRAAVVGALASLGTPEEAKRIEPKLTDDFELVRVAALGALSRLGGVRSARAIELRLKDECEWVRISAVRALGVLQDQESIPQLAALLQDGNPDVQIQAMQALTRMGARSCAGQIVPLLREFHHQIGWSAAESLVQLQAPGVVPAVEEILSDPKARSSALRVLGGLRSRVSVRRIRPFLRAEDPEDRAQAAAALGQIGDPAPILDLVGLLEDPMGKVRAAAVWALGGLEPGEVVHRAADLLVDGDSLTRTRVIEILERQRQQDYAPHMVEALDDPDLWVAHAAAGALCSLGRREGAPHLLRAGGWALFPLNALREPAVWDRLAGKSLEGDWIGHQRDGLDQAAREGSLRIEGAAVLSGPGSEIRLEGRKVPLRALDLLRASVPPPAQVILEKDQIRLVTVGEAVEFWKGWWKSQERRAP